MGEAKPKVFAWVNAGAGTEWQIVVAMAEDGTALASHCSSSEYFAKKDIAMYASKFAKHYPDGYELEWVSTPRAHKALAAAMEMNGKAACDG